MKIIVNFRIIYSHSINLLPPYRRIQSFHVDHSIELGKNHHRRRDGFDNEKPELQNPVEGPRPPRLSRPEFSRPALEDNPVHFG
jgi:hypothetical protein